MYIGIDDTDSFEGMCTTYLALEIVREFVGEMDLVSFPRLVRLNPNIPWKTRGNGAICLHLAQGSGNGTNIGSMDGLPVNVNREAKNMDKEAFPLPLNRVLDRIWKVIEKNAHLEAEGTNSALVVSPEQPSEDLYWQAVREVVDPEDIPLQLPEDALVRSHGNGRGIVGASAAISWPARRKTYELLVYRERQSWGTPRNVDIGDVKRLDERFPQTFNNYDPVNDHPAIIPGTPCPILFGIRSTRPDGLLDTLDAIRSEPPSKWVIFETNQGTDDHMVRRSLLEKYQSGIVHGVVVRGPEVIKGGHVFFSLGLEGENGRLHTSRCAAYEPTKEFRDVVRRLRPGDRVTVFGSRTASNPETVNVEKLRTDHLVPIIEKVANPVCTKCDKRMKSMGSEKGFRCKVCGAREPEDAAETLERDRGISIGLFEVPICARRHLHRPLDLVDGPGTIDDHLS